MARPPRSLLAWDPRCDPGAPAGHAVQFGVTPDGAGAVDDPANAGSGGWAGTALAVIADGNPQPPAGLLPLDGDAAGLAVLDGVADGFGDDVVRGQFRGLAKPAGRQAHLYRNRVSLGHR